MTEIEQYQPRSAEVATVLTDPTGGRLVAWAAAARAANALAASLVKTSFVPKDFRGKPEEATAAILLGDELGLSPISALRSVFVIHGTPSIYAKTMVALVQSHGHEIWTESSTEREVVVSGQRKGSSRIETSKWDIARAQKAKYTTNSLYSSNPQEMLWAKAAAEVCKRIASDVLAGVPYTVEDLQLAEENQPTEPIRRASARVQRTPKPQPPEPEFDEVDADADRLMRDAARTAQEPVKATSERAEPGITDAQSKALHASLRDANLSDRDAGLAYIGDILGREIQSTKELSKADASFVIDTLKREAEAEPAAPEPLFDGGES